MQNIKNFEKFSISESVNPNEPNISLDDKALDAIIKALKDNPRDAPTIISIISKYLPGMYEKIKERGGSFDLSRDLGDLGF